MKALGTFPLSVGEVCCDREAAGVFLCMEIPEDRLAKRMEKIAGRMDGELNFIMTEYEFTEKKRRGFRETVG